MKLRVGYILNRGVPNQEHVAIYVDADTDLQYYAVFETLDSGDGRIQAGSVRSYWFPAKPVKAGEVVVLFTGAGTNNTVISEQKVPFHFFYWGRKATVFQVPKSTVALMELSEWATLPPTASPPVAKP